MALRNRVDQVTAALDAVMKQLKDSLRGIPIRQGSFRNLHDQAAREVACLLVELETLRGRVR